MTFGTHDLPNPVADSLWARQLESSELSSHSRNSSTLKVSYGNLLLIAQKLMEDFGEKPAKGDGGGNNKAKTLLNEVRDL
mmetsp:Transcript_15310/g.17028  ORF Transcript_15310/g.17028 Transcript_15310/m.17028 type:complete len:80 (+) Transcript_15310:183-422(+)